MSRDAELLAAILADPDDDQARHVYGDVLLAHGDPRGELIGVQVRLAELADADDDPAWPALARREQELLAAHQATWLAGLDSDVDGRLHRGFIDQLRGSSEAIIAAAPEITAREPVTRVEVVNLGEYDDDLALLPRCGALRQVRALALEPGGYGTDPPELAGFLGELASSPSLASLVELDVRHCAVGAEGAAALVGSPLATRLQRLDVARGDVGIDGVATLLGGGLPALRWLGLAETLDGVDAVRRLVRLPGLRALRGLDLTANGIANDGAVVLSAALPALDALRLRGNQLRATGCAALATAPALRGLRRLDLANNPLGAAGAAELADGFPALASLTIDAHEDVLAGLAAARWPSLRHLELRGLRVGRALRRLDTSRWPGLRHLAIDGHVDADAAFALADNPGLSTLTTLRLWSTELDDTCVQRLAMGRWPALHTLELGSREITDVGALALARSAGLPSLCRLELSSPGLSPVGLAALREHFGAGVVSR